MKAILKLGYLCNNNCVFCHASKKQGDLDLKQVKKKIDNLQVKTILFSGGEPTIRKDIFKILDYASSKGMETGLVTNARMLSNKDFVDKLPISYCYTTLHSSDPKIHNRISQTDSYDQTVKGIKNIVDKGIYILVNVVLTKHNLHTVKETVEFLKKTGVDMIKLSYMEPMDDRHIVDMVKAADTIKPLLDKSTGWDGFPLCLMRGYEERLVNLKTQDIRQISETWEDKFFSSDCGNKTKINKCRYCIKECEGIYSKYLELYPKIANAIKPYVKSQIDNEMIKDKNKGDEVRLVLLAARACCLNCKYCFVKRTNEVMESSTLKKSIDFLMTSDKSNLQLQYFGGEPLMLPDVVFKESIRYAVESAKALGKNIKIIITTNSVYLKPDKIKFLENYKDNIVIEVSLDGDRESQNINRPQKNKDLDSYEIITKNFPCLIESDLNTRVSMVIGPETCGKLLHNFEHLLSWGFNKIWMMLACGVKWTADDIKSFKEQLNMIKDRYYGDIKSGKIKLLNLRDWFAPYRMNTELIIDLDERIYPACMNYLIESDKIKDEFCLGDLNDLTGNIDHYDKKRITNDHSISIFFKENDIIPNYDSNIKTGLMINDFVKEINDRLRKDGIIIQNLFKDV